MTKLYAEALFHTAKYRPEFPVKGFADLDVVQGWAVRLVRRGQRRALSQRHAHVPRRNVTPGMIADLLPPP